VELTLGESKPFFLLAFLHFAHEQFLQKPVRFLSRDISRTSAYGKTQICMPVASWDSCEE
jgi:hypothetical protein